MKIMKIVAAMLTAAVATGCSDIAGSAGRRVESSATRPALAALQCTARLQTQTVSCQAPTTGASRIVIGGQNIYVRLASSNVSYDPGTEIFQFDVTVQNLLNEAIGTPDGFTPDPGGIQVFVANGINVTDGSGDITVANQDGNDVFTTFNQPYWAYHEILEKDEVSGSKTWQFNVPATVNTFSFTLYLETDVQYLLVLNEVLVNPAGNTRETEGDWVEIYNAGTLKVDLQNLVITDSAASGRRPYHLIASSLVVQPGAYVVLGGSTNTTTNGGVPVDYSWGGALSLASSLDAVKIARVYGTDTLTIDRTQYSQASVSAQDGISRELKNPALDNSNMDGSNWGPASVTSVYGVGGRGTPKAQNSVYTP